MRVCVGVRARACVCSYACVRVCVKLRVRSRARARAHASGPSWLTAVLRCGIRRNRTISASDEIVRFPHQTKPYAFGPLIVGRNRTMERISPCVWARTRMHPSACACALGPPNNTLSLYIYIYSILYFIIYIYIIQVLDTDESRAISFTELCMEMRKLVCVCVRVCACVSVCVCTRAWCVHVVGRVSGWVSE